MTTRKVMSTPMRTSMRVPFDQEGFELNRPRRPTILGFRGAGTWDRIAKRRVSTAPAQMRPGCWNTVGLPAGAHALWSAGRLVRSERLRRQRAHARGDLWRHAVIAQDVAYVAQPAGLALHHEMPQRD